jgi:putative transposase
MRSSYKFQDKEGIYFVTSTVIEWVPIFTSASYFNIMISALKYCQTNMCLNVFAYVFMENHYHLVCQAPDLSKTMQSYKRHTAKKILEQLETDKKKWVLDLLSFYKKRHKTESDHQFWQEGSHPQQVVSNKVLRQKIQYIHYNPVRRGYVAEPEHWVFSSAGDYILQRKGVVELQALPT